MDTKQEMVTCSRCGQEVQVTEQSSINLLKHSICDDCLSEEEALDLYYADQEELQKRKEELAKFAVKLLKTAIKREQDELAESEMPLDTAKIILNEGKLFEIDVKALLEDPLFSSFLNSSK
jgi:hypothetical protein